MTTPDDDARDAARWRWLRDHARLSVGEDDDLYLGVWLCDGASERGATPYLTRDERARVLGRKVGPPPGGDAVTRAVDFQMLPDRRTP